MLKQVIENQMENDRARYRYVYEEKAVVDRYGSTGKLVGSASKTYTWIHTDLESFSKLISINGAPYDRQYLQAQDNAIQRSFRCRAPLSQKAEGKNCQNPTGTGRANADRNLPQPVGGFSLYRDGQGTGEWLGDPGAGL